MNEIDKSLMISALWDKYVKTKSNKNYQIWKNFCYYFYPKKIEDLK